MGYSRKAAALRMSDAADEMMLAGPKVSEDRDRSVWLTNSGINTRRTSAQMPTLSSCLCFCRPTI